MEDILIDEEYTKRRKKRRIRTIIILLAIAAAAGGLYYYLVVKNKNTGSTYIYKEASVEKGDISVGVEESGSVTLDESSVNYDLETASADDTSEDSSTSSSDDDEDSSYLKIEKVYAVQGQRISEGDKLFKLTDASVRSVRRILESNASDAEVTLAEAESSYTLDSQDASNTASSSQTAAAVAQDTYDTTVAELQNSINSYAAENQVLQQEIQNCQANLTNSDFLDDYETAKETLASAKSLFESTDEHNVTAYVANQTAYETAQSSVDNYEDQIDTWNDTITDDMKQVSENQAAMDKDQNEIDYKKQNAENDKNSAQLEGSIAGNVYNNTVSGLSETVTEAQTDYDEAEQQLEKFNAFVGDDGIIYADGSGLVTTVAYEEGDELTSTGAMLSYVKSDGYTVSVDVSEEDVPTISVGEAVKIVFTAYPDETYDGTVSVIGTSASDEHSTTVSYPVTVTVDGDTTKLYGGMTADVTFVTDSVNDVLYVSTKAIVEQDNKSYVYMKASDGTYALTEVTTGFTNGTDTEIKDGLKEGDTIYIRGTSSEDESTLKDTSTAGTSDASAAGTSGTGSGSGSSDSGTGGNAGGMSGGRMPSGGQMPSGGFPGGGN